jgi:hypothetical protein
MKSLSPNNALLICVPSSLPISAPLLCASSSYKFVALRDKQRVENSSSRSVLVSLLLSLLDTISSMPCLFVGISSSVLHSSKKYSLALPPGVISFLLILDPTPHRAPLAISFPLLSSTLFLISTLISYLSSLFLLYSSGSIPYLTSSRQFMYLPQQTHSLSFMNFPQLCRTPPLARCVYLAIRLGSMRIIPFSTKNILIQSGIPYRICLVGPSINFISASLNESLYSTMNSTMYTSFTQEI